MELIPLTVKVAYQLSLWSYKKPTFNFLLPACCINMLRQSPRSVCSRKHKYPGCALVKLDRDPLSQFLLYLCIESKTGPFLVSSEFSDHNGFLEHSNPSLHFGAYIPRVLSCCWDCEPWCFTRDSLLYVSSISLWRELMTGSNNRLTRIQATRIIWSNLGIPAGTSLHGMALTSQSTSSYAGTRI